MKYWDTDVWYIPITYVVVSNRIEKSKSSSSGRSKKIEIDFTQNINFLWLRPTVEEVVHDHQGSFQLDVESPIFLNINNTGLYHVKYDERNWKLIGRRLKQDHTVIPLATRMQLADAIRTGWEYNYVSTSLALCVGEYIKVRIFP